MSEFMSWLIETSLALSLLTIAILILRRPVAKFAGAEAAYLLWLALPARLFLPELKILPQSWRAAEAAAAPVFTVDAAAFAPLAAAPTPTPSPAIDLSMVALAAWGAGAILFFGMQLACQRRFIAALRAASVPPSAALAREAAAVAQCLKMKRAPEIILSARAEGPMVAGLMRPLIVLPADFESVYTCEERDFALTHEMTHVARGDLAAAFAALLMRSAEWPNPLAHFAFRAFRVDQEAACDRAVIAAARRAENPSYDYGAALVKAASRRLDPLSPDGAPALTMSNHLKERLMLLKTNPKFAGASARAIAAAFIVSGLAASASYSWAADDAKKGSRESTQVIAVDAGEKLKINGDDRAAKIEVKVKDGKKTVKTLDAKGKLLTENVYGADDETPYDRVVIVDKKGKESTVDLSGDIMPPMPPDAPLPPDVMFWSGEDGDAMAFVMDHDLEGDGGEHRVEKRIMLSGDFHGDHKMDCSEEGAETVDVETSSADGKKVVRKEIVCIAGSGAKDPATRAEALRKALDHMEKENARRDAMMKKLRADLAAAEKEAAKKK